MTTARSHVGRQLASGKTDDATTVRPFPTRRAPAPGPRPHWLISDEALTKTAYIEGWRAGIGHGLVAGLLLGALMMSAAFPLGHLLG
jgi:predicted lipid-binding transport protein (Tim44 family)